MTTNEVGRIALAKVLARLAEKGKHVLVPFSNVGRYDLMVDEGTRVVRVECKTARYYKGCLVFNTSSRGGYKHRPSKGYTGDADLFGVWSPKTEKVYLVPVVAAAREAMNLRVDAPKRGSNLTKIKWAKDFEF